MLAVDGNLTVYYERSWLLLGTLYGLPLMRYQIWLHLKVVHLSAYVTRNNLLRLIIVLHTGDPMELLRAFGTLCATCLLEHAQRSRRSSLDYQRG